MTISVENSKIVIKNSERSNVAVGNSKNNNIVINNSDVVLESAIDVDVATYRDNQKEIEVLLNELKTLISDSIIAPTDKKIALQKVENVVSTLRQSDKNDGVHNVLSYLTGLVTNFESVTETAIRINTVIGKISSLLLI